MKALPRGGVAVIVEAVTDNKQRTVSEVKNIFDRAGGTLGSPGSVSYLFTKKGEIVARKNGMESEDLLGKGIDAGVDDMEEEGDSVIYYVDPQNLQASKKKLEESGINIESAQLIYSPQNYVDIDQQASEKVMSLVEKLEESDDVQEVYTNLSSTYL